MEYSMLIITSNLIKHVFWFNTRQYLLLAQNEIVTKFQFITSHLNFDRILNL